MSDDFDPVDRPAHYADGALEPIDVLEHMLSPEEFRGFLRGTLFYYNWRHGKKDARPVEAGKMRWFAQRLERLERDLEAKHKQGEIPLRPRVVVSVAGPVFQDPWRIQPVGNHHPNCAIFDTPPFAPARVCTCGADQKQPFTNKAVSPI